MISLFKKAFTPTYHWRVDYSFGVFVRLEEVLLFGLIRNRIESECVSFDILDADGEEFEKDVADAKSRMLLRVKGKKRLQEAISKIGGPLVDTDVAAARGYLSDLERKRNSDNPFEASMARHFMR